jgi:hypothetical protein
MRSNDVWLGAAYDFFQFTRVQIAMASVLGIEPGKYAHHVGSLHIYEQHYGVAEELKYTDKQTDIPVITGRTWDEIQSSSVLALHGSVDPTTYVRLNENEKWYADAMKDAIEKNKAKADDK